MCVGAIPGGLHHRHHALSFNTMTSVSVAGISNFLLEGPSRRCHNKNTTTAACYHTSAQNLSGHPEETIAVGDCLGLVCVVPTTYIYIYIWIRCTLPRWFVKRGSLKRQFSHLPPFLANGALLEALSDNF